jgi:uncharacterized Tic20 family protein
MSEQTTLTQDEKTLAGLAHGGIILGFFTSGVGGLLVALVIWLTQKEKSAYAAGQALQALIYQAVTFVLMIIAWCCWAMLLMAMLFIPLSANPDAYATAPPASFWVAMVLMIVPFGFWGLTILYGLYGALRCFGGDDFKYAIIGNWLKSQS